MVQFTPDYINFIKSNLSIGEGTFPQKQDGDSIQSNDENDQWFQILIFEEDSDSPQLVYGTKQALEKKLKPDYTQDKNEDNKYKEWFPSLGTSIDDEFMGVPDEGGQDKKEEAKGVKQVKEAQRSTVRFLKQARELSQRMAATWLNEEKIQTDEEKIKIKLSRKILNSYNIIPAKTVFVNVETDEIIEYDSDSDKISDKLKAIKNPSNQNNKDIYLIRPEYVSYSSISLSLLLCGQAYYQKDGNWKRIWKPIFSNYEMVYEYALDLSWDTYYATRKDIAQPGRKQNPPYTKVTLGYPPRPPEFNLTQEDIQKWVNADDKDGEFPFYPRKRGNGEFENDKIDYVAPPFPYLPLSTV
jgi:phage pi2 protein 07